MRKSFSLKIILLFVILLSCLGGCTSKKEKVQDFIQKGNALMEKGDPVRAALEYKNAIQLDPQNAEATYLLGRAFLAQNKLQKAFGAFSRCVTVAPHFDEARIELASLYLLAKQPDKALEQMEKVEHPEKYQPKIGVLKAKALVFKGEYQRALDVLANLKGQDQKEKAILESICLLKTGQIKKMKQAVAVWRKLAPRSPGSYIFMARFYAKQGDRAKATKELEKMAKIAPSDIKLRLLQAKALEELGMKKDASAIYQNLPVNENTLDTVVNFYMRTGKFQKARDLLRQETDKNPEDIKSRIKLAEVLFFLKEPRQAQELVERLKKESLNQAQQETVLLLQAMIFASQGKLDEAQNITMKLLAKNQGLTEAHLLLGKILLAKGDLNSAEIHLNEAVSAEPANIEAQILLAKCLFFNKKEALAEDTLVRALTKNPGNKQLTLAIVKLYETQKDVAKARNILKQSLKLHPDDPVLLKMAGELELKEKNFKEAEGYFKRILEIQPRSPLGPMEMGKLMLAQKKFALAEQWFKKAQDMDNGWEKALPALVQLYLDTKQDSKALSLLRSEAEKRPDSPLAQYYYGKLLARIGKNAEAERALNKALRLAPKWLLPYRDLANLYLKENKIDKAIAGLKTLLEKDPTMSTALSLATLYEYKGDYQASLSIYKSLLEKYGNSPLLTNNIAYIYAEHFNDEKKLKDAQSLILQALSQDPNDPNFLDTAGWIEYKLGNLNKARDYLQKALDIDPNQAIIKLHLAQVAYDLGQKKLAYDLLKKATTQIDDQRIKTIANRLKKKWSEP